jgi:hypothetical protein
MGETRTWPCGLIRRSACDFGCGLPRSTEVGVLTRSDLYQTLHELTALRKRPARLFCESAAKPICWRISIMTLPIS